MTRSLTDWARQRAVTAELRGITWDHPRGYQGLFAATRTFEALHPEIRIVWDRHSLRHFEAHPIDELAAAYDLIVLDHPFMGAVAASQAVLPLDELIPAHELDDLANDVAGRSFVSYRYDNRLWALPIDAACQASVHRPDLLAAAGCSIPRTLDELFSVSRHGSLALALLHIHSFLTLATICANLGAPLPEVGECEHPFPEEIWHEGLEILQQLADLCPPEALGWNSIACLDAMSSRDDLISCPYVFSFASYSQSPGDRHQLVYDCIPSVRSSEPAGAVLGGTGIAISARTQQSERPELREAALSFARFVTSRDVQVEMGRHGGQPARRSAWLDPDLNLAAAGFYRNTLETIDRASMRPRFAHYIPFQNEAGAIVENALRERHAPRTTLERLNVAWRRAVAADGT